MKEEDTIVHTSRVRSNVGCGEYAEDVFDHEYYCGYHVNRQPKYTRVSECRKKERKKVMRCEANIHYRR